MKLNILLIFFNNKVDVNLFFNVINYLMDSSNEENLMVKLICLKQLTRLCIMKYDYVIYPRLSKELVNLNYEFSNDKNRLKVLFTKAFCIHQLILYRYPFLFSLNINISV